MNRALIVLLVLVLAAAAGAYAASPLWTFHELKQAARAGDKERLDALIDFPAVREDLKHQVDSRIVKLARETQNVGILGVMAFGKLGSAMGDRAIDRLVTPEAIAAMVNEGRNPRLRWAKDGASASGEGQAVANYAYLSPDRFRVGLAPADQPDKSFGIIMERRGLFSWRVERLELPK